MTCTLDKLKLSIPLNHDILQVAQNELYLWDTINNVAHFPNSLGCIDVWEVMGMSVEQLPEAEGSSGIIARQTDHHDGRI